MAFLRGKELSGPLTPIIGRQDSCISLCGKANTAGVIAGLAGENRIRYGSR
ncbi:hypothetical protein [Bradyrhizobium australiense]|uniref:Uncharacterized protein n=1 Tax=Bradyrhizobium australiense TaxID=2721161 RepID=A0A7Y4LYP0_9BRAD|nr:hypothetical protein [Bradyrhizobium australiense]NOJ43723.1 hypothetical protein [Bradyrhizobium australiense]